MAATEPRRFLLCAAYDSLVGVDPPDLTTAIGTGLGLTFSGPEPAERQLLRYVADLELLLVLDNYEHLLPETKLLSAILREAPDVTLLVTSRERLGLKEEWLFETEGLPYPPAGDGRPLAAYDAVQLFARRAAQVRWDF